MNKNELGRLGHLMGEARDIEQEIAALGQELRSARTVADAVTGSATEYPYTRRVYSLVGVDRAELARITGKIRRRRTALHRKKQECEAEYERLTAYIEGVPDPYLRRLLLYRYREGLEWDAVAARVGGGNTADGVRMAVGRYLQK